MKVLGWARKWHADGEVPAKVRNENGRMVWPAKFKFLALTEKSVFKTDVPLVDKAVADALLEALAPFAALLHEREVGSHHCSVPGTQPIYAINGAQITLADLRRARAAVNAFSEEP